MPKCVNKVILVGNVGKDPEVRYSQSSTPVANFSLATNERFKGRNDEWQERTEWHSIVAWQRLAEIVGEYVAKGSKVYVEGKLRTTSWEDRQRAQHALKMSMDELLEPIGIPVPQYNVLSAVQLQPGISNAALARGAFVAAQSMQGIVANLERIGLLRRKPHLLMAEYDKVN
jgi:primosomal replication protein N